MILSTSTHCHRSVTAIFLIYFCLLYNVSFSAELADKKLTKIKKSIAAHQQKIAQVEEEKFNLLQELRVIENQLEHRNSRIIKLQQEFSSHQDLLNEKNSQFNVIQAQKNNQMSLVEKRLKSYYQSGKVTLINTLFSAKTLPDLLNLKEYFQAMIHYDKQIIQNFRDKLSVIEIAQNEIQTLTRKLKVLITDLKEQGRLLATEQQKRFYLLERIKVKEMLFGQALEEMQLAASSITSKAAKPRRRYISPRKKKISRR